ncbi:MAG: sensor histidine kinase [Planctomycetaceae bacterium]
MLLSRRATRPAGGARLVRRLLVALVLLAAAPSGAGGLDANPPLTPITEIRALATTDLARHPEVRVRGVVTRARGSSLFMQDESAGIYVNIARSLIRGVMPRDVARPDVPLGSEIEIVGVADPGGFSPIILPRSISVLGPASLPEPRPLDADAFFEGVNDSQFVEVTGVVEDVAEQPDHWRLSPDHHSRPFLASIVKTALAFDPRELVNATVRVRGPTSSMSNTRGEFLLPWVFVERPDWLEVVTPQPYPPFESPKLPLEQLARFHTTPRSGGMVRTEGTVSHVVKDEQAGREIYLQDGASGLRVTTRSTQGVEVGDRLEVAGFVRRDGHVAGLAHGVVRRLAPGPSPEPFLVTPERIEAFNMEAVKASVNATPGDYHGCLVRFPARLVDFQAEKRWGTLVLSTGSTSVSAEVTTEAFDRIRDVPSGSEVQVTGIALMDWDLDPLDWPRRSPRHLSLILRSADDVVVLRRPSPWTSRRLATLLGAAMAALAVTGAWAWSQRRRREELEGLVQDRTRELTLARQREQAIEEEARQTLQKKLRASLAASAVAHEINQPLSRILLTSRLELDGAGDGREALRRIVDDADRVVTTIEKMKVLLRNVETQHKDVDLVQVVRSSLFQVKAAAATGGVAIRPAIAAGDCPIRGDAVQLQLAIANLVRNAVEAIVAANSTPREVEVKVARTAEGAVLTVGDSGPGWPGGSIDDALAASTKPQGTGVGLFVVRTAVENHGGTLTVGRSPLGGAEFRIVLPVAGNAGGVRRTVADG